MANKVRAYSKGSIIWINEATAKNEAFLKKYNIRVDDESFSGPIVPAPTSDEPRKAKILTATTNDTSELPEVPEMADEPASETDVEVVDELAEEEKPKRTRKPKTEE
jgi:hypothetical protein